MTKWTPFLCDTDLLRASATMYFYTVKVSCTTRMVNNHHTLRVYAVSGQLFHFTQFFFIYKKKFYDGG